jgi:autoinducer 2-degrading protein
MLKTRVALKSLIAAGVALALAAQISAVPARSAAAQQGPLYVNVVELDIVPADFNQFIAAAKTNAVASMNDAGCHQLDIAISQQDPHHVIFFEVYDNEAALRAHHATDHFKAFEATTKGMVAKSQTRAFSSVAMNATVR